MYLSPLYSKERTEEEGIVYSSLSSRKKTLREIWSLAYVLGCTKADSAQVDRNGNISADFSSGADFFNKFAISVLPLNARDTYRTQTEEYEKLADTEEDGKLAISDVINPGYGLLSGDHKEEIGNIIENDGMINGISSKER